MEAFAGLPATVEGSLVALFTGVSTSYFAGCFVVLGLYFVFYFLRRFFA